MSQIRTNYPVGDGPLVNLTQGSAFATFTDTDLTEAAALIAANRSPAFIRRGIDAVYSIIAVEVQNSQVQFSVPYAGADETGAPFEIHISYSPISDLAEFDPGDIDWPIIMKHQLIRRIDGGLGGGNSGHTIQEAGTPFTARAGLNFAAPFDVTDDAGNNRTTVTMPEATTSVAGLQSAADKAKQDKQPTVYISEGVLPIRATGFLFLTVNTGYILAATQTALYRSADGGSTWESLKTFSGSIWISTIFEDSAGNCYFSATGGTTPLPEADCGIWRLAAADFATGTNWVRVVGPATSTVSATQFTTGTSWTVGDLCVPSTSYGRNKLLYEVTSGSGTTTESNPWPRKLGSTVTQGGVTFTNKGLLDWDTGLYAWNIIEGAAGVLFATIYSLGSGTSNYYRATTVLKGVSGGTAWTEITDPAWNVPCRTHGHILAKSPDGTIYLSLSENINNSTVWGAAGTRYIHQIVRDPANEENLWACVLSGESTGSAPFTSSPAIGDHVTESGGVVWEYIGRWSWQTNDPLIVKTDDDFATWSNDFGFDASRIDGGYTSGVSSYTPTEILPISNTELVTCLEAAGWGILYRRATNGTYTRVRHDPMPNNSAGFDTEPGTSPWTSNVMGKGKFSDGTLVLLLTFESGYLVSVDSGLTWVKRQIYNQIGTGGFFRGSNVVNDRLVGCLRDNTASEVIWDSSVSFNNVVTIDILTESGFSIARPLPFDNVPKGAWHDHTNGAGSPIPLTGIDGTIGKLGIGTASPETKLHVVDNTAPPLYLVRSNSTATRASSNFIFSVNNPDLTNGNSAAFQFNSYNTSGAAWAGVQFTSYFTDHTAGAETAELAIRVRSNNSIVERVTINGDGLSVNGTVNADYITGDGSGLTNLPASLPAQSAIGGVLVSNGTAASWGPGGIPLSKTLDFNSNSTYQIQDGDVGKAIRFINSAGTQNYVTLYDQVSWDNGVCVLIYNSSSNSMTIKVGGTTTIDGSQNDITLANGDWRLLAKSASATWVTIAKSSAATSSGITASDKQIIFSDGADNPTGASTAYWDKTNSRMGIGTSSPGSQLHIYSTTAGGAFLTIQDEATSAGGGGGIVLQHTGASSAWPVSGDWLGWIAFGGKSGTTLRNGADIEAIAAENYSSTTVGTHIVFRNAPVGGTQSQRAERLRLAAGGRTYFSNGGHLPYGSFYVDDGSTTVSCSVAGTYYQIGGGMSDGGSNGFTFQNSKELLCLVAGKYKVDYSLSIKNNTANHEIGGAVMVNGSAAHNTEGSTTATVGNSSYNVQGTGIISLAVNDLVSLSVVDYTGGVTLTVAHANITVLHVGS